MPEPENPVDEYINQYTGEVKTRLEKIRKLIKESAPAATETISYRMPTYKQGKNLVHFAGYENHIGFYPTPSGIEAFQDELKHYKTSKGAIQFQHNEPIPYELIKRIVQYRVQENQLKN